MEILANNPINRSIRRYWSRRNGYQRLDGTIIHRKPTKVTKFGSAPTNRTTNGRRFWKLKHKLRRLRFVSPLKLWTKLKNGYMNMMLGLAGNVGDLNGGSAFGGGAKRIPKARSVKILYSKDDFENRLIFEIYKSMVASGELSTTVVT